MSKNAIVILTTLITGLFIAAFIFLFYTLPQSAIGPEQPIPFSHNVHSGVKQIQCQYCHPYVAYSNHPGIPAVEKCLHCHNYIIANHPWIKKEHEYFNTKTPTPWIKLQHGCDPPAHRSMDQAVAAMSSKVAVSPAMMVSISNHKTK